MSDPQYLSDEGSEATDFERELLQAAQGVRLTVSEKQAIWAGVALHAAPLAASTSALPGAATPGTVAPSIAAAKLGLSLTPLLKGVLFALGLGGLSLAGFWLSRTAAPSRASAQAAPSSASSVFPGAISGPSEQPAALPEQPAALPEQAAALPEQAAAPSASARDTSPPALNHEGAEKSALRDESTAVLEIRRTLRAGDASGALRLLEQARQRFPKGALSQEREALNIEALAKSGAKTSAARLARAFLRAYPKSPYASDVQSFTAE